MSRFFFSLVLLMAVSPLRAADASTSPAVSAVEPLSAGSSTAPWRYKTPRPLEFVTNIPGDMKEAWRYTFRKEHTPAIALVTASTLLTVAGDQWLIDKAQIWGHRWGIQQDSRQASFAKFKVPFRNKFLLIGGPTNFGQGLYFMGDGWVQFGIASSFLTYGLANKDDRALQTASQIAESVFASGTIVQVLKHTTGRQSPFVSTTAGGHWKPFPNQFAYAKNVSNYDAYPSGHVAATMATFTVMQENYSEVTWIKPLKWTWITILSFQMMNNGVHWASDYPLGYALGYVFAKVAINHGREAAGGGPKSSLLFTPINIEGAPGLALRWRFS